MNSKSLYSRGLAAGACLTALLTPAWSAPIQGRALPVGFHTDQGGQSARSPHQSRFQNPASGSSQPANPREESAFLRVVLPKTNLVVGELVPVEIKAYFRAGVSASLNGLPMLASDAFALNKLGDHPEQTQETIDGVAYSVVTWSTALSGVKAGEYPLNLDLPVMVRSRERGQRHGGRNPFQDFFGQNSPFGDSFFDDFFAQTVEKPLTLHTDGSMVKISSLPAAGRPTDFSGAVGQFAVTSEASTASAATGDPLTLKVTISGRGNFDRVTTSGLAASSHWKTYKPSPHFTASDSTGVEGEKTFEQAIVPAKAGAQEIPGVHFSYFDPSTNSYVTKTTAPIAISATQAAIASPVSPISSAQMPPPDAPKMSPDELAPDEIALPRSTARLRPVVLAPWFIALNASMIAALAAAAIYHGLRRRRATDPRCLQHVAAEKAVSESLTAMDAALNAQDAPGFFTAARHALQDRLAEKWQLPATRVTLAEIRSRLNGSGEQLRSVFQTADEIAYSGRRFSAPDLQHWRALVRHELERIPRL